MSEHARVDLLLRRGGEGVVPCEGRGVVLRAEGVVRVEVRFLVRWGRHGGRSDARGEEEREEGEREGERSVREAGHWGGT